MSLVTRELPPNEWCRLAGTDLRDVWQKLSPESARIVVVEDAGQIVGHCTVLSWVHLEGLGIAPTHRRTGLVWRRLMRAVADIGREVGVGAMVAGTDSDAMTDYLRRLGGTALPATFYVMPMRTFQKETGPCLQS
jgi:hypothetical protein